MNKLSKIASIIVILTCAGSLYFAFKLGGMKTQLKADNSKLTQDLGSANTQLTQAKAQLQQDMLMLQRAQTDVATANANMQAAQVALGQKTGEANSLKASVTELEQKLAVSNAELKTAKETIEKIQEVTQSADFQDLEKIRDRLQAQSDENKILSQQLSSMRDENQSLRQQLEAKTTTPVGLRGKVAIVQDSWGFLVLDIGHVNDVKPETEFLVYRDSKFIAKAQVTSVDSTTSVATILPEYRRGTPRVGDLVVH